VETEFNKVRDDLQNHKTGILDKLQQMLIDSISDNLAEAKKIDWEKQINKGDKVAPNGYMMSMIDDMTKMYNAVSTILPN